MKKPSVLFFNIITALGLVLFVASCNQKAKNAKIYRDNMVQWVQPVIDSSLGYGDVMQTHVKQAAINANSKYLALVNQTLTKVEAAKDFEGDTVLSHYSLEMLGFYKNALEKSFKPALEGTKAEAFSPEEAALIDSLYTDFTMRENQYWDRFNWAEKKFSKEQEIEKVEK